MPQTVMREGFKKLYRRLAVGTAIIVLAVLATGWANDHRSCVRSVEIREYIRSQIPIEQAAVTYWQRMGDLETAARIKRRIRLERSVRNVSCSRLLPEV